MNRALYSIVRWWFGLLPVDDSARRAFDETLADWRNELAAAEGAAALVSVALRGVLSAFRSVALVAIQEMPTILDSGIVARMGIGLLAAIALQYVVYWPPSPETVWLAYVYGSLISVAFFFPAMLLVACLSTRTSARIPALGLGGCGLLLAALIVGWAVPASNQGFRELYPPRVISPEEAKTRIAPAMLPVGGREGLVQEVVQGGRRVARSMWPQMSFFYMDDRGLAQQIGIAAGEPFSGLHGLKWLSTFGAYLTLCLTLPWLAVQLRPSKPLWRWWAAGLIVWLVLYQTTWGGWLSFEAMFLWMFFGLGTPWVPVLAVLMLGSIIQLLNRRSMSPLEVATNTLESTS